jgi:hypothetical protein
MYRSKVIFILFLVFFLWGCYTQINRQSAGYYDDERNYYADEKIIKSDSGNTITYYNYYFYNFPKPSYFDYHCLPYPNYFVDFYYYDPFLYNSYWFNCGYYRYSYRQYYYWPSYYNWHYYYPHYYYGGYYYYDYKVEKRRPFEKRNQTLRVRNTVSDYSAISSQKNENLGYEIPSRRFESTKVVLSGKSERRIHRHNEPIPHQNQPSIRTETKRNTAKSNQQTVNNRRIRREK